jgi:hypothetical protein
MPKESKEDKKKKRDLLKQNLQSAAEENKNIDKFKKFAEEKRQLLTKLIGNKLDNIFIDLHNSYKDEIVQELSQYIEGNIFDVINNPKVNIAHLIENNIEFGEDKNILINGIISKIKSDYKTKCGVEIEDEKIIELGNDVLKVYLLDLLFKSNEKDKLNIASQIVGMLFDDIMKQYDHEMDIYEGDEPRDVVEAMEHITRTFEAMDEIADGENDIDLLKKIIEKHKLKKSEHFLPKVESLKYINQNQKAEESETYPEEKPAPKKENSSESDIDIIEKEHTKPTSILMKESKNVNWGRKKEESPYSKYQNNEYEKQSIVSEHPKREGGVRSLSKIKVGGIEFIESRDGKGKATERSFSSSSKDGSIKSIESERHPDLKEVSKRLKNATMEHGDQEKKRKESLNKSGIFRE